MSDKYTVADFPAAPTANAVSDELIFNTILENPALVMNAMTTRADLMSKLFDPRRDIDDECGYPKVVDEVQYRRMYDREMGRRVVNVYPEETWKKLPRIYEDPDPETNTEFEASLDLLEKKQHLLHYLQRADELSGVGHYGIILWGLDDGLKLHEPVEGWEAWEETTGVPRTTKPPERRVTYTRVLDESLVRISMYEQDVTSPRFGRPTEYTITLNDPRNMESKPTVSTGITTEQKLHWTRVTHVADNRKTSEVIGTPRQEPVWNRLYDLRKVLGGSGEMYWRGGFPGVSLETQPGNENGELDEAATRTMMFNYMNGLQRYIALTGMSAKSLTPQISDPSSSFECQIKAVCVIMGVPFRVFMGIEEGVVSGDQVTKAWDGRLENRQARYVTPMIIDPVLQRLIDYGALKPPVEEQGWTVEWPDLTAPSDKDKAEVGLARTEAFAKYVQGGVDALIPPLEYLTQVCGLDDAMAQAILDAAIEHIDAIDNDDETVAGRVNTPEELVPEGGPGGEGEEKTKKPEDK